jgi:hypothetical protein
MKGKNMAKTQEKAIMSYSKSPIHWCKRESQLRPFNATCQKIVARGESRAARDSRFCERDCREEHHCNKSDAMTNILTNFLKMTAWLSLFSISAGRLTIIAISGVSQFKGTMSAMS